MSNSIQIDYRGDWTSIISATSTAMRTLGIEHTVPELYGASGHAFLINCNGGCASGPTAWNQHRFFQLIGNLGASAQIIAGDNQKAWDEARKAIESGTPCLLWDANDTCEHVVIFGYTDDEYMIVGPCREGGKARLQWKSVRLIKPGLVILSKAERSSAQTTLKASLQFAIEQNDDTRKWSEGPEHPWRTGPDAYDYLIEAVKKAPTAADSPGHGICYNLQVWGESRSNAVKYLRQMSSALNTGPTELASAIARYEQVGQCWDKARALLPWAPEKWESICKDSTVCSAIAGSLTEAKHAESKGIDSLRKVVEEI